uniref:hypothetical protein n=1 Tax=Thaumasiovibrio occultus TaxID=1891184 RepID=UPI00131C61E4
IRATYIASSVIIATACGGGGSDSPSAGVITSTEMNAISDSCTLRSGSFECLETTNAGADGIQAALNRHSDEIRTITLFNNPINNSIATQLQSMPKLSYLHLNNTPGADALDLSTVNTLEYLSVSNNATINRINLGSTTTLRELVLSSNSQLQQVDISNYEKISKLDIRGNSHDPISIIGFDSLGSLESLALWNTQLTQIDLSNHLGLTDLNLGSNPNLTDLNLGNITQLEAIWLYNNEQLTSAQIPTSPNLSKLSIESAQTPIQLNGMNAVFPKLYSLKLNNTTVTSLDLSTSTELSTLTLENNEDLTSVDISTLAKLRELNINDKFDQSPTRVDLIGFDEHLLPVDLWSLTLINTTIQQLDLTSNHFDFPVDIHLARNQLLDTVKFGSGANVGSLTLAINGNLTTVDTPNLSKLETLVIDSNASLSVVDLAGMSALTSFTLNSSPILNAPTLRNLDAVYQTLTSLELESTLVSSLDTSQLTNLTKLALDGNNALSTLDVAPLSKLSSLSIAGSANNIIAITGLEQLSNQMFLLAFNYSDITAIDLTSFANLSLVDLSDNELLSSTIFEPSADSSIFLLNTPALDKSDFIVNYPNADFTYELNLVAR